MPPSPLLAKSLFVGLDSSDATPPLAHLCTGGEAPWLKSHDAALRHFGELKSGGMAGRDAIFDVYARAKQRVASLLGITPSRVAFLAHATEGLNQAVSAVDW